MKKVKLLIISNYLEVRSGADRIAVESAISLAGTGRFEIKGLATCPPASPDLAACNIECFFAGDKDLWDAKNRLYSALSGLHNRKAVKILERLCMEWKPDLVHIHSVSRGISWSFMPVLKKFGIPCIYTSHGFEMVCPNGLAYNFNSRKLCSFYKKGHELECLLTDCDKVNYAFKLWRWARFALDHHVRRYRKKLDAVIFPTEFAREFVSPYLHPETRKFILPNPVDKDIPVPGERTLRNEFVFVGQLLGNKGLDVLIDACDGLDTVVHVFGSGSQKEFLMNRAQMIRNCRFIFHGWTEYQKIRPYLVRCLALVFPSLSYEVDGLVIKEANSLAVPVISSGHSGLDSRVEHMQTGLVVKRRDKAALRAAMERLMEEPELSRRLGRNAFEFFKDKNISLSQYTERLEQIIENVLLQS